MNPRLVSTTAFGTTFPRLSDLCWLNKKHGLQKLWKQGSYRHVTSVLLRKQLTGQEQTVDEIRKLKDLDMVFNRYEPKYVHDKFQHMSSSMIPGASPIWWRMKGEQVLRYFRNTTRAARIYSLEKNFDEKYLGNYAFHLLRQVNTGLIVGNMDFISESVIQSLGDKMRFIENTVPLTMPNQVGLTSYIENKNTTPFSGRITKILSRPYFFEANIVGVSRWESNLKFGQLTFRIITEQEAVYNGDALITKYFNQGRKITYGGKRRPVSIAEPKGWKAVLSPKGKMYYYHTGTKQVTWTKPASFGVTATHYDPSSGTLGSGRILESTSKTTVSVENYVTLQKPLYNPKANWRLSDF